MFNADLALSVTMTAVSTILSCFTLPINLLLYSKFSYDAEVVALLDWASLFTALVVVIGAICLGLFCSAKVHSHQFNVIANKVRYKELKFTYIFLYLYPQKLTFSSLIRLVILPEYPL